MFRSSGSAALTSFVVSFLSEYLKVKEPGLQPGHHEGGDGQHVAKCILGQKSFRNDVPVVLKLQSGRNVTSKQESNKSSPQVWLTHIRYDHLHHQEDAGHQSGHLWSRQQMRDDSRRQCV